MDKVNGVKVKMTQIWKGEKVVPVTVIKYVPAKEGELSFNEGDNVMVSGYSKGKGFQGVVKRHGFHGGPKTHGQKNRLRAPGSIGATAPQRVHPGRKMAGRMGNERVSVKNLTIETINKEESLIMVRGAVPGKRGSKITISKQ